MKCKTLYCNNKTNKTNAWYYCSDCLREIARKEMRKYPDLFSRVFPELFPKNRHTIPIKAKDVPIGMDVVHDADSYFFNTRHKCLEHIKKHVIFQIYDKISGKLNVKIISDLNTVVYWREDEVLDGVNKEKLMRLSKPLIKKMLK